MAYRRRGGMTRSSTFQEDVYQRPDDEDNDMNVNNTNKMLTSSHTFTASSSSSASLAAQAIRASAAHRDSSVASAYAADSVPHRSKVFEAYEDSSARNDSKGFWGVLARKAKAILEDDSLSQQLEVPARSRFHMPDTSTTDQNSYAVPESVRKIDNPTFRKGLDKITSSLNHIGDTFEKAFEEGRNIVETKTADIIQETRKLQIRRKGSGAEEQGQQFDASSAWQQPPHQQNHHHETQLKASRDIRLQLETLLAEKARLAHENSMYARENRFLREIVEYHQLTMQDVVYLDEGIEEVTEIYPLTKMLSISPPSPMSPISASEISTSASSPVKEIPSILPQEEQVVPSRSDSPKDTGITKLKEEDTKSIPVVEEQKKDGTNVLKESANGS